MDQRLEKMRERQKKRRELLAKQLGVGSGDDLSKVLSSQQEQKCREAKKRSLEPHKIEDEKKSKKSYKSDKTHDSSRLKKVDDNDTGMKVYKGSSTFLKGTQSLNPHNDYCQNYVDTGQRPQNYIRDVGLAERFGEYPKLKDLIRLKDDLIRRTNTPPTYLKCDLNTFDLKELDCTFDVILIEPPLEEYKKQAGIPLNGKESTWNDVMSLEIEEISAQRSFVFLWCGSSDGLDSGRLCLKKWGFRRCEDICWIKTNLKKKNPMSLDESLFVRTKEHCLMGIKGTVRRSTDGDFIHANVDIDLIIDDEMEPGSNEKPEEIFHIIEHFCLGRRRLHLFGRDTSRRPGWLTMGPQLTNSNFDKETFSNHFRISEENLIGPVTGCTEEIERLRPKTPPPRDKKSERGGSTRGSKGRGSMSSRRGDFNSTSRIERTISGGNREPLTSPKGFPVPFHDPRDTSFKKELRSQGYRNKDGRGGNRDYQVSRNIDYSGR